MKDFPQLSPEQNRLLQVIFEQLPQVVGLHLQSILEELTKPSSAEYVFQAVANNLSYGDLQETLEDLALNREIDLDQLDATRAAYPSIITDEIYQSLLHHFEE